MTPHSVNKALAGTRAGHYEVVLAKPMTRTAGHCLAAARSAKSFLVLNCTSYPLVMSGFFGTNIRGS